jgi:hypothetical protein
MGVGLQLQMPEAGMIRKQETVTIPLNFYILIHEGLMGWNYAFTLFRKVRANGKCHQVVKLSGWLTASLPM